MKWVIELINIYIINGEEEGFLGKGRGGLKREEWKWIEVLKIDKFRNFSDCFSVKFNGWLSVIKLIRCDVLG